MRLDTAPKRRNRFRVRSRAKRCERGGRSDVKRFGVVLVAALAVLLGAAPAASAAPYTADKAVKINVMGEWAHPDDDTSIIGPCGVWHQRYGVKCGIIMVTRGEGGGNAVGVRDRPGPRPAARERGPRRALPLRHGRHLQPRPRRLLLQPERAADAVFWGEDETLRRVTRIIRMTQPDIYIGFTPTLAAGHGNHQQAGRYIWEGIKAAADPTMFPEQLTGPNALSHLAGQEGVLRRRRHRRHRRHDDRRRLHHRLHAARRSTTSPASGRATTRRTCGRPATSRAARRARRRSGRRSRPRAPRPTRRRAA